ncbi:MAG TPA: hypothetical protein VGE15_02545 [Sphingobacteriaceae bacterium]
MKTAIRFFAILDMISILLLIPQLYHAFSNLSQIPGDTMAMLKIGFTLLTFILLFVSASGAFRLSKAALISYYVQFPMRLVVWIFSFGFLTFLSQYFPGDGVFQWIFRIVFVLEFFRVFFTVQIQKALFSKSYPTIE